MQEEIYNTAGHLIRRLNQISMSVFQNRVRAAGYDLTSVQFAALVLVRAHPGIDQAGLAGLIAYDRATIGGVVDRLESKQLLDRRVRELRISAAGIAALEVLQPVVQALQDEILTGLDAGERVQFLKLAAKAATGGNALSRAPLIPREGDS